MSTEMTEFDVLIFLKGVPDEALCGAATWEVAAIGGSVIYITNKLAELNPRFRLMVDGKPEEPFRAFMYRGMAL